MHRFQEKRDARRWVQKQTRSGQTVGVVPTMGALHRGHLSLVQQSVATCDATVATIFVNPTQFGPQEDFAKYPRTLDADLEMLKEAGADAVFVPDASTMYRPGFSTYVSPPAVAKRWEGECRPDHFRGVTTVVAKLFHILPTTHAFFGQKDFQQARVLQTMANDLDFDIDVITCPILREDDGLAMSSRNRYLTAEQRGRALALFRALESARQLFQMGERRVAQLEAPMRRVLEPSVDEVDYAVVVDAETLEPIERTERLSVALIAARVGETRLIDNLLLDSASRDAVGSERL